MKDFQTENNELLLSLIDGFIEFWRKPFEEQEKICKDFNTPILEFDITASCNQRCHYCYLVRYGKELYPIELRDEKTILSNLKICLNTLLKENLNIPRIDLFTGEIWGTKLGYDVLTLMLEYIKKGAHIKSIIIPSNCSFVLDKDITKQIQYLIDELNRYGCRLSFSASVDGKIVEPNVRPFANGGPAATEKLKTDEYYDNLFAFCYRNHYGFHPMVAAYKIEKWKENIDWWYNQFHKHQLFGADVINNIMFLEVRNDDWTDQNIIDYLEYLNYLLEKDIEELWGHSDQNLQALYDTMIGYGNCKIIDPNGYLPYIAGRLDTMPGCSISYSMMIRLGDLSLVPCHRTSYKKLLLGQFTTNGEEITGIIAQNPFLGLRIWTQPITLSPRCDICPIKLVCLKGCYGSQYETNGDMFYPCPSVCKLFKIKYLFLYNKLNKIKEKYNDKIEPRSIDRLLNIYQKLLSEEKELCDEWMPRILEIL